MKTIARPSLLISEQLECLSILVRSSFDDSSFFVFGSKRGSSQSSTGTQVLVLPALEQARTDIFSAPMPLPKSSGWLGKIGMKRSAK
jgi:hypothetical protein